VRVRVLIAAVGAVVAAEGLVFALLPGAEKLRRFVDLVTVEALVLAVIGALAITDRPFLAARMLLKRAAPPGEPRPDVGPTAPRDRGWGWWTLGLGAALFAFAALVWALRGNLSVPSS